MKLTLSDFSSRHQSFFSYNPSLILIWSPLPLEREGPLGIPSGVEVYVYVHECVRV